MALHEDGDGPRQSGLGPCALSPAVAPEAASRTLGEGRHRDPTQQTAEVGVPTCPPVDVQGGGGATPQGGAGRASPEEATGGLLVPEEDGGKCLYWPQCEPVAIALTGLNARP